MFSLHPQIHIYISRKSLFVRKLNQPSLALSSQMLLEKLNGTVPCLLDTSTIPAEELTMSTSRSVANSGLSESLATSTPRASNGDSPSHPYQRTFSPHFHHFVEQCLQRGPDVRYIHRRAWPSGGAQGALEFQAGFERQCVSCKGLGFPEVSRAPTARGSSARVC